MRQFDVPRPLFDGGLQYSLLKTRSDASYAFQRALNRGRWRSLLRKMAGRPTHLSPISPGVTADAHAVESVGDVEISLIIGSEAQGRLRDFDLEFNPLSDHNRERWIDILTAQNRGVVLPPVELIRIGDRYFVRDGHHRISVASARGQKSIEAQIVQVRG